MAMIGVGDVERSRGKKMKKILLCIVLWIILITGCSSPSSITSEVSSNKPLSPSDIQIDYLCEDNENGYYYEETSSGYELYRQRKKDSEKTLIRREDLIYNLTLFDNWLYYVAADQNICRVMKDSENYSIVLNYESLQGYADEPVLSLHIVDNLLFIQMSFALYRYDLQTKKIDEIYYDARHIGVLKNDIYFSGRDATIYKMDVHDDEPKAILQPEINGDHKEEWKNLYKNFILVDGILYYYKRNPDGLYRYQNEESVLIDDHSGINEISLYEHDKMLYYIIQHDETVKLMNYNPKDGQITEVATCNNYSSGSKIRDGYFYYWDLAGKETRVQISYEL